MVREISAGGVVVRHKDGEWWMAAIVLPGEPWLLSWRRLFHGRDGERPAFGGQGPAPQRPAPRRPVPQSCSLPAQGLVDPGRRLSKLLSVRCGRRPESPRHCVTKLADIKYVYVRSWGDGERVFKIVSFYLLKYESGRIDDISDEMRIEVARSEVDAAGRCSETARVSRRERDGAEGVAVSEGASGVVIDAG